MAFDPVTLLTISVFVLFGLGGLMLDAARGPQTGPLLRWTGGAFLCLGAGLVMILAAPTDIHAPLRVLGTAATLLPYGLLWAAARRFDGRPAPFEIVAAGALAWLVAVSLVDLSQLWRVGVTSAIVALYSVATAREHRRGDGGSGDRLSAQRWAARIFAAHGAFFALRAVLGPGFGTSASGTDVGQLWGAMLGLETVLMAITLGVTAIAMDRERAANLHRREALEDALTGIGNRRALFRSGAALIANTRRAGLPTALLLMDLDGFKRVNDRHGHPGGDRLLVAFAHLAHDYLPPTSLVCRVGGEEFAAILPGADAGRARAVADEIRALFAHVALDGPQGPIRTTVSVGVALSPASGAPAEIVELLGRADLCLYAAKHGGRDRVVAEGDPAMADGSRPLGGFSSAA